MSENEVGTVVESAVVEVAKPKPKAKKGAKPRKARRETINAAEFVRIYKPMAEAGKSAKEIAKAMDRDVAFVCVRATSLRKAIKKGCLAKGFTPEQIEAALLNVPMLRGGGGGNVLEMLGITNA